MSLHRQLWALAVLGAAVAAGCTRAGRIPRGTPIILISVDTLRADHLPAYGYRGVATPNLDALRRDSILFENAYAQVPLTLPSHAVILTGMLPFENGVRDNIGFRLAPLHTTLASRLKAAGYATGAVVSSLALRSEGGLDQGFDLYDDHFSADSPDERPGRQSAALITQWIGGVSERPFFAFLHIYEPHAPYVPPEPFRTRYAEHPYDGEIATADAAVGEFLDGLRKKGIYSRALIVFLSDHGEGLGDHGEDEHGVFLYREALHVPLWLKLPTSRDAGRTVSRPVALLDVVPTVLAALGLDDARSLPGVNLLGSPSSGASRRIYAETLYPRLALGWSDLASLVDERFQYIEAPRPELYDLLSDPSERKDLASGKPDAFRVMRAELAKIPRAAAAVSPNTTPEEIEKLGALGYISLSRGAAAKDLPDPKDRIVQLRKYKKLFDLYYAQKDREVIPAAEEILAEDPQIASVWRMLAKSRERLGDLSGAARDLAAGLEKSSGAPPDQRAQMLEEQADVLLRAGRRGQAEQVLRAGIASPLASDAMKAKLARLLTETGRAAEAVSLLPAASNDPASLDTRGAALAETGRLDEARQAFLAALEKDPGNAAVLLHLGMLSMREKDPAAARVWFERSLASQPNAPATLSALGLAQIGLHDETGAFETWTKAVKLDPKQYDTLFNLAVLAGRMGRTDAARASLERFIATAPSDRYADQVQQARRLLNSLPRSTG